MARRAFPPDDPQAALPPALPAPLPADAPWACCGWDAWAGARPDARADAPRALPDAGAGKSAVPAPDGPAPDAVLVLAPWAAAAEPGRRAAALSAARSCAVAEAPASRVAGVPAAQESSLPEAAWSQPAAPVWAAAQRSKPVKAAAAVLPAQLSAAPLFPPAAALQEVWLQHGQPEVPARAPPPAARPAAPARNKRAAPALPRASPVAAAAPVLPAWRAGQEALLPEPRRLPSLAPAWAAQAALGPAWPRAAPSSARLVLAVFG